jgi:hypothetical protein
MRKHPEHWDDMSNYVVHFTKGGSAGSDYATMMHIYGNCMLKPARRFGIGKDSAPDPISQEAVCFSEIPPGQWQRMEERRATKYGLGFNKQFLLSRGGGPIWYAWKETPHWLALQQMMKDAVREADAPIWRLTPMIDAPGKYCDREYLFDWEREWRHIGPLNFTPDDVAFLLIPESLHSSARSFFEDAYTENIGPAYFCPYVDPAWDREKIMAEIRKGRHHPEPYRCPARTRATVRWERRRVALG